jgi:thiosulfate/3-mercaptopyruvate sulfurtransferase
MVAVDWLAEHADVVVVADVRLYFDGRSAVVAYEAGHIPGAIFVDLETALADDSAPASAGRHPLPAPDVFAAAMGALGIGDGDTVIAYDDAGGVFAARLVWMLRAIGHETALLDGGIQAWTGPLESGPAPGPLQNGPPAEPSAVGFTSKPWPAERLATIDDAASAAGRGVALIDARQRERFDGAPDDLDPRGGHIPGARSLPCRENLDAGGRLLPASELKARFAAAGIEPESEVISYCGSGVTACHNLLALEQAGFRPGRLYPGSWSQWSRDPSRPAA